MILMYHNIDEEVGFNTISTKNFEEQVLYLTSNKKLNVVSMDDYIQNLKSENNNNLITITFDDAYESIKLKVLPIIKQHNIPITVFVPVNMVGKHNTWDTVNGNKQINILDWTDIQALNNESLITFGSHGLNHISLGTTDIETVANEFIQSKEILESKTGSIVNYFSFPFGQLKDIRMNSHLTLKNYGYQAGFTTIWSRANHTRNIYLLNRVEIQSSDNLASFIRILNRKIDFKYYKQKVKNLLFTLKSECPLTFLFKRS